MKEKIQKTASARPLSEFGVASRLVAAAADVALVLDKRGVVTEVALGQSIEAHVGWKKLVGQPWVDTLTKDSQPKLDALLAEASGGQTKRPREINQRVEGLGEIPLRASGVLLDDAGRIVIVARDLRPISALQQRMVTAQQAMDREFSRLRQADTRYRVLFHVCSEGVLVAEAQSLRIVEANPAASHLLDEPAQALHALALPDVVEAASRPALQALLAALEAGGRPSDARLRFVGQRDREMLASGSLFRQSGTTLVLLRFWPASETAGAEAPRASRMLAAIDAMPDGFVVTGEDRRILSANVAFCELVSRANEKQVLGEPLDRWLGRPGVDLNIMLANLREHGTVRNFSTIVRGDFGPSQEALVTAVSALDGKQPCLGFTVRPVSSRLTAPAPASTMPRSVEQLRELVGRVSLKQLVRESADLVERLCIEAALDVSGNNRASAAQLLGLSRQGLYSKLRRYGLAEFDPT
jgi:transcriptional regulator PpsR